MAKNVFDNTLDVNNNVNTNSFDHSHTFHLSTELGRETPVFCTYVPPKTTYRFNAVDFGLQMMPSVFPFQTPVRARLNFFKMELRAMNEDYTDMVSGVRQDVEEPYVALEDTNQFSHMFGTSKLGDYLGLPTKVSKATFGGLTFKNLDGLAGGFTMLHSDSLTVGKQLNFKKEGADMYCTFAPISSHSVGKVRYTANSRFVGKQLIFAFLQYNESLSSYTVLDIVPFMPDSDEQVFDFSYDTSLQPSNLMFATYEYMQPNQAIGTFQTYNTLVEEEVNSSNTTYGLKGSVNKISSYPFRFYEAVHNCYYRDSRNNPYVLNGRPVYNKWLPTMKSGADPTVYTLHNCNWERDAFTTAVQNPQQGIKAPLAGITSYTTSRTLESGEIQTEVKTALVTEDGKKYALDFQTDDEGTALTGVKYTELTSGEQVRPVTTLSDLANSGVSIETLRYVNAYQKYLELNMRKGFSYRDIMQGRWDIDIRFDELLMPTFIGGVSRELNMNAITQTVDQANASDTSYESALGSQSGIAGVYGQSDQNIEVFCDEASYIMAILTIVPTPIYSQLTPKHYFYRDLLDTPQPEFQNIGFQPILKKELNIFDKDGGEEVFGYQRPWYEFCQMYDTAHGSFRDTLGNFLMKRTFLGTPELGQSFLQVDPSQLTDVFSVTKVGTSPITDHIYGFVRFNITAKLPINRIAIPRLD